MSPFLPRRRRGGTCGALSAIAVTLVLATSGPADGGPGLALVSATAGGTAVPLRDGIGVTPDGRYVTFCGEPSSVPTTGLPGAGAADVYVKDLQTGALSLVSVSSTGATGSNSAFCGYAPSISNDGRYVAFVMDATNLAGGVAYASTGNRQHVFLRDRQAGTTTLVSRSADGLSAPGQTIGGALVSGNGRFVVFMSSVAVTTFVPAAVDSNSFPDLYAYDRQSGTLSLVNVAPDGVTTNNFNGVDLPARRTSISDDGKVLFAAPTNNLVPGNLSGFMQVYVRDLVTKVTRVASSTHGADAFPAEPTPVASDTPYAISSDGRYVVFINAGQDLVPGAITTSGIANAYVRDLVGNTTTLISVNAAGTGGADWSITGVTISGDGSRVAMAGLAQNLDAAVTFPAGSLKTHVFTRLRAPATPNSVKQASVVPAGNAPTNGDGFLSWLSPNGRHVAFRAFGTDTVSGVTDANNAADVAVRDLVTGTTVLHSTVPSGTTTGNASSGGSGTIPTFVGNDGRPVFTSFATDLVTGASSANVYGYAVVAPTFSITGTVTQGGSPLAGVTMSLSGTASATTTTSAQGTYAFSGLASGGNVTVTPALAATTFTPTNRAFANLAANQVADFSASCLATVTGLVRDGLDGAVPNVTITLAPGGATTTTDVNGRYTFTGLAQGATFTLTPSRGGFTFNPVTAQVVTSSCDTNSVSTIFVVTTGLFTRYFAEGATGAFFDTAIALLNATGTPTTARVTFQTTTGQDFSQDVPLNGIDRATVNPEDVPALASAEFSTVIVSDQPVIADRTMRWDSTGYGAHAETSIAEPLTTWYLAEGATISGFNLFYLVQNPNAHQVTVTVTFLLTTGAPIVKTYQVAASTRLNIWVNTVDTALASAELSAIVSATAPVIVERAMYRDVAGQMFGAGHESAGVPGPASTWFVAEGATGSYFDLFYLVANPNTSASTVEGRYLLPNGSTLTKTYTIPPQSRFNIWADLETFPGVNGQPLADTAVSAIFTVTNDVPVIVERAMWWPGGVDTWFEGHNSAGALLSGTKWGLADGEVGGPLAIETYILIANTSAFAGEVQVTLVFEDGTTTSQALTVAANSRTNFDVRSAVPTADGRRFGAIVESLGPTPAQIVVERAMYNDANGLTWAAGSNNLGTRLR
jgi:hypothetical protein